MFYRIIATIFGYGDGLISSAGYILEKMLWFCRSRITVMVFSLIFVHSSRIRLPISTDMRLTSNYHIRRRVCWRVPRIGTGSRKGRCQRGVHGALPCFRFRHWRRMQCAPIFSVRSSCDLSSLEHVMLVAGSSGIS